MGLTWLQACPSSCVSPPLIQSIAVCVAKLGQLFAQRPQFLKY